MRTKTFFFGALTGLVSTLALGAGVLMLSRGASANDGFALRFGDAISGALARQDAASPATGAAAQQQTDNGDEADTDGDAEDVWVESHGDGTMHKRTMRMHTGPGGGSLMAMPSASMLSFTHAFDNEPGVLVAGVDPEGPAAEAGLARGDVITAIDGEAIEDMAQLHERLAEAGDGAEITLSVTHGDEARDLTFTLDEEGSAGLLSFAPCGGFGMGMGMTMPHMLDVESMMHQETAFVAGVVEGSAAEAAGLAEGDVITAIDGAEVASSDELAAAIAAHTPGETVTLTVAGENEGESRTISAVLGSHPDDDAKAFLGVQLGATISIESLGGPEGMPFGGSMFEMHDLDGLDAFATDGVLQGAVVHGLNEEGPAHAAGLNAHDVILSVDGQVVAGADELIALLEGVGPGATVSLTVARSGDEEPRTISITLGERPDGGDAGWLGVEVGTLELRFDEDGSGAGAHMRGLGNHLRGFFGSDPSEIDGQPGIGGAHKIEITPGDDGQGRIFKFRMGPNTGSGETQPSNGVRIDGGGSL